MAWSPLVNPSEEIGSKDELEGDQILNPDPPADKRQDEHQK
jgi:hypothetical protein